MEIFYRAKETVFFLPESEVVHVNYIPWLGDILSNVAAVDDVEWAELCSAHAEDQNRRLVDEHKSKGDAIGRTWYSAQSCLRRASGGRAVSA